MLFLAFAFVLIISLSTFTRVLISEKKGNHKLSLTFIIFLVMVICIALELLSD